jgi:predicted enzyme related to lactoylglutathione lyase
MSEHAETPKRDNEVDARLACHGHVSYLEIPALDIARSASFYATVFGWNIRHKDNGQSTFDDGSGALIGRWVTDRGVSRDSGLLPYIFVDEIDVVVEQVVIQGGEITTPPYPEGNLWAAVFRDPAGNVLGVWQVGPRKSLSREEIHTL